MEEVVRCATWSPLTIMTFCTLNTYALFIHGEDIYMLANFFVFQNQITIDMYKIPSIEL